MYLLFALGLANLLFSYYMTQSFLSKISAIATTEDLERFKNLAKLNMYQALVQYPILVFASLLGIYGIIMNEFSLLFVLILNGLILVIAKLIQGSDKATRNLPVSDKFLESQYKAVCDAWVGGTFPNF